MLCMVLGKEKVLGGKRTEDGEEFDHVKEKVSLIQSSTPFFQGILGS